MAYYAARSALLNTTVRKIYARSTKAVTTKGVGPLFPEIFRASTKVGSYPLHNSNIA